MAKLAQRHTRNGKECVLFLLAVLRGEVANASVRDRIQAARELLDRSYGRPAQQVDITPDATAETLLLQIADKLLGRVIETTCHPVEPVPVLTRGNGAESAGGNGAKHA